ncbi:MAG: type II toxin-antitoxin system VapC family toxin [Planctomycetota bacterium]
MRCLLDTCTWIWAVNRDRRLSRGARRRLETAADDDELHVSVISCWEVAKLVEKGRLSLSVPVRDWVGRALERPGLSLVPLSPAIAVESTELPGEMSLDPADQIIVATARHHSLAILTPDRRITEYDGVQTVW